MNPKIITTKFNLLLLISSTLMVAVFSVMLSYALFTAEEEIIYTGEMGLVDTDINVYFDDGSGGQIPAEEVQLSPTEDKTGIYRINITDNNAPFYVEDLRISINVNSSVDTYFRIKIYEQMTFLYTDINGFINELAIRFEDTIDLNYDFNNWYDNTTNDGYLYYQNKVKRINETTPLIINLVDSYFSDRTFNTRAPGYSLQIAFSIEAVQGDSGPEFVWDLATPPWGGVW